MSVAIGTLLIVAALVAAIVILGGRADKRLNSQFNHLRQTTPGAPGQPGHCARCYEPITYLPIAGVWQWCDEPTKQYTGFVTRPHRCGGEPAAHLVVITASELITIVANYREETNQHASN